MIKEAVKGIIKGSEKEDIVTKTIEGGTAKIPSVAFLGLALGCVGVSLGLQATGRKQLSNFVGQWVPTLLILGLYNKLVKQHGH